VANVDLADNVFFAKAPNDDSPAGVLHRGYVLGVKVTDLGQATERSRSYAGLTGLHGGTTECEYRQVLYDLEDQSTTKDV
jgi:hypothetical protein